MISDKKIKQTIKELKKMGLVSEKNRKYGITKEGSDQLKKEGKL